MRGDALLGVGKHAEAIADYDAALKFQPDESGVLNNLAWVLATSPQDALRDGQRALKLATTACEVTKYEAPHILSTLAAAYAETGDFPTAIEWSTKAVALAGQQLKAVEQEGNDLEELKEQLDQLEKELAEYQQSKPWGELIQPPKPAESTRPQEGDLQLNAPQP